MLFYVPPMGPVLGKMKNGDYDNAGVEAPRPELGSLARSRIPIRYMASLFSGGNEEIIREVYRKKIAVRLFKRSKRVKDIPAGSGRGRSESGRPPVRGRGDLAAYLDAYVRGALCGSPDGARDSGRCSVPCARSGVAQLI